MTDDIKKLIAEARKYGPESMSSQLIRKLADALEAEHHRAEAYKRAKSENDERFMIERDQARAERDALRTENRKLIDKLETAMGVSEENDALRTAIQGALMTLLSPFPGRKIRPGSRVGPHDWVTAAEEARNILSRAIDTKEKP